MDGLVVRLDPASGQLQMAARAEADPWQVWLVTGSEGLASTQFTSLASGRLLSLWGLSDWRLGPENSGGFVTIAAAGGLVYDTARLQPVAWTRGWAGAEAGQRLRVWNLVGNKNQRFKLVPAGALQGQNA